MSGEGTIESQRKVAFRYCGHANFHPHFNPKKIDEPNTIKLPNLYQLTSQKGIKMNIEFDFQLMIPGDNLELYAGYG